MTSGIDFRLLRNHPIEPLTLDVSGIALPPPIVSFITEYKEAAAARGEEFTDSVLFHRAFQKKIHDDWQEFAELGRQILAETFDGLGFSIVQNLAVNDAPWLRSGLFVGLALCIGDELMQRDSMKTGILSEVKPVSAVPDPSFRRVAASTGADHLHTDGTFLPEPPDVIALSMKRPALIGGASTFAHVEQVIRQLLSDEDGRRHYGVLKQDYPFRIASVYRPNGEPEIVLRPIIREKPKLGICFRFNYVKGLPIDEGDPRRQAINHLQTILEGLTSRTINLNRGDMTFLNNRTVLHGRTEFTDSERHLQRAWIRCAKH